MLLHDDVVSDGQTKARALSSGLRCKEWVEHLFPYLARNPIAVVANPNLNFVTEVFCRRSWGRLTNVAIALPLALCRRIEAVGDQVKESPRDLLRKNIDLTGRWIEAPLHIDLEALLLGASAMVGEIEALLDESIDVDRPMLAR